MSLRFALLLAGVVLVAAVYGWGALRRRHRARGHYRQRFQPFRPPEQRLTLPDDDFDDGDPEFEISSVRIIPAEKLGERSAPGPGSKPMPPKPASAPAPRTAEPSMRTRSEEPVSGGLRPEAPPAPLVNLLSKETSAAEELPAVTHRPAPTRERKPRKKKVDQMALPFEGLDTPSVPVAPAQPEQQVLSLVLQAPRGKAISGENLSNAMHTVGLRYGEMRIFHHYGAGELRTETPLFSVANMFEPGYFDLDHLDAFETEGIAFFMQLPSPLDGAVAFELFLNTAQRLAEALKVELYSAPGRPLDSAAIDRMRRIAARYGG